ncbi:MAG: polysaccharide deacetylase family protein [Ruminococcus sp.]
MKIKKIFKPVICALLSASTMLCSLPYIESDNISAEESKLIALTFDDGPNTTTTNEVLDILEKYNATASFFLVGNNINEESAVTVKRAYDMGCEIDNHSKTHPNMSGLSEQEIIEEIEYVDNYVYEIIGEYPKFFRPPYIDTSQLMYDVIDKSFICGIGCSDYLDSVTAEERSDTIISSAKDGLIVLLHDAQGNYQTVEALETIIPALQADGYEFVTLTELFERQGEQPKENILYSEVAKYPCKNYSVYKNLFKGEATGDPSWPEWSNTVVFDCEELEKLGDSFAIEAEYDGTYQPVIALQKWTGGNIWCSVQPGYYNGEKACFLASDIQKVLTENNITLSEMDRISIMPFGGTMTLTSVNILINDSSASVLSGDVNDDGNFNVADLVMMRNYLLNNGKLTNWTAGDLCNDDCIDIFDYCIMKKMLTETV